MRFVHCLLILWVETSCCVMYNKYIKSRKPSQKYLLMIHIVGNNLHNHCRRSDNSGSCSGDKSVKKRITPVGVISFFVYTNGLICDKY